MSLGPLRSERWFEHAPAAVAPRGWGVSDRHARRVLRVGGAWSDGGPVHGPGGASAMADELALPAGLDVLPGGWRTLRDGRERIWLAVADDRGALCALARPRGASRWESPRTLLEPALDSERDGLAAPTVAWTGDRWMLWYAARADGVARIHAAASRDGDRWERHGIALDAGSLGDPDSEGADCPAVARVGDGFAMAYRGIGSGSLLWATSEDGLTWRKHGPLLFRGAEGSPDEAELGWPCLLPDAPDGGLLRYAGRDREGRWSLLECALPSLAECEQAGDHDPHAAVLEAVERLVETLDERDLELRLGPSKHAPTSAAASVRQLFPSSTPVFVVGDRGRREVVKFGRSARAVEREYDRARALRAIVPVVPSTVRCFGGRPVLMMPWLDGVPLADVSDDEAFDRCFEELLAGAVGGVRRSLRPYDGAAMDCSTQTPAVLLERLAAFVADPSGATLAGAAVTLPVAVGELGVPSLVEAAAAAASVLLAPPSRLAYFEGDFKLEHVLVGSEGDWALIDSEYAGWYDVDWIVHLLLLAAVVEGSPPLDVRLTPTARRLRVELGSPAAYARRAAAARRVLARADELAVDRGRVLAYQVAQQVDFAVAAYPTAVRYEAFARYALASELLAPTASAHDITPIAPPARWRTQTTSATRGAHHHA